MLHAACLISDGQKLIPAYDNEPSVTQTSYHFHKLFMKCAGYALEFDTSADSHYDATGLGRVHKEGAPSPICISQSCPSHPDFAIDIEPRAVSLCSGVKIGDSYVFLADTEEPMRLISTDKSETQVSASFECFFSDGRGVKESYTLAENGVRIAAEGDGEIAYMLPAFAYDGEKNTEIKLSQNVLTISYEGYMCRYTASGKIFDLRRIGAGRNGHYKAYAVSGDGCLRVNIEILKN